MASNQLFELKTELVGLCKEVAHFIRDEMTKVQEKDIEHKELNSLVSYVDQEAERRIVDRLQQLTPQAGFITEENTVKQEDKNTVWIIDPLDGTTNYLHRIPHFSISIALQNDKTTVLGIVYEIMLDTSYTAIRGFGAWENDKTISVSNTQEDKEAIVVTGFPYKREDGIDMSINLLKHCVLNYRGVRRLGSAALDLAYVASGKIDIYYESTLNIWDLAAGALIVEEAGGKVTDYQGEEHYLDNGMIISSNGHLHDKITDAIKRHLYL